MKNLILLFTLIGSYTTLKAADIHVNNSGNAGTYTTISAGLTAAAANDRVIISSYGIYTESLSITKSVTLTSSVSGVPFTLIGGIAITGTPNMEVRIIGCEASSNLSFAGGTATLNDKADVYVVSSSFSSISLSNDFCIGHVLFCSKTSANIIHGEVRGCMDMKGISITDGSASGIGDTVFIVGNVCTSIYWNNDDHYFYIANNSVVAPAGNGYEKSLTISLGFNSSTNTNMLVNNYFHSEHYRTDGTVVINNTAPANIEFWNCIIANPRSNYGIFSYSTSYVKMYASIVSSKYGIFSMLLGSTVIGTGNTMPTVDQYGRSLSPMAVDQGAPNLDSYDIDLTRNDIGTYGGPYSIDNYINTATGKARVYHLDIPFEIWSGQTPQVKAKSVHTK
ncbi:hypothetical protein N8289_03720 [Flavobacteriales bacterium]|nr:hypothetical protein [Flavobacteriales bacterium]